MQEWHKTAGLDTGMVTIANRPWDLIERTDFDGINLVGLKTALETGMQGKSNFGKGSTLIII